MVPTLGTLVDIVSQNGKNQELVNEITVRLRTLDAQFRKVKGHNNDQWNDRAEALVDMGRDEALGWPRCSFEVVKPDGRIAFKKRQQNPDMVLSELMAQLKTETDVVLPGWREIRVYKANMNSGANQCAGVWTPGHFILSPSQVGSNIAGTYTGVSSRGFSRRGSRARLHNAYGRVAVEYYYYSTLPA
jgi:hypothetical protein